ncbi:3-oxoacyl-[acyl-carrier-protein] reductase FabG-like [Melitaea cinxia]|uniref:3-oxoacyl-[acyl-carrier-protein] reductase FabG-like n=1 Tax=Melitaea cinxia TaxID=113334 RepID=UPI001E2738E0|nr:3-oxoacyl-[acyl-carrier-protein] reductase FabG-like [Melitaea cinxia]
MSFSNKVVIVTGASSGIGAATAIAFVKEGANVVIVGRNVQKLQRVNDECVKVGKLPLVIRADVSNDEDSKRIINETIEKYGQIDVLVNNAGIIAFDSILDDNIVSVYDSIMKTNMRAVVSMTHLAAPHLIKTKGNIVNISSVAGKITIKDYQMVCYSSSKAALDHFTRLVAAELAKYGVRVNAISPGPVKTDIAINAGIDVSTLSDEDEAQTVALGRISEPEEIADLILFVASDKAKAITGSDYVTDNGAMLV